MILELILNGILQWNLQTTKIEKPKEGNGQLTTIISGDFHTPTRSFSGGDSVYQIEEKEKIQAQQKLEAETSQHGSSYTGTGSDIEVIGYSGLQCVPYAREQTGNPKVKGYAGDLVPETQTPQIGAVALETFKSKKGTIGHASVVIDIYDGAVRVRESNYYTLMITERTIPTSKIKGYLII